MALVERYRDCTEYSDEVLRQFVEKVIVHETVKDEDGERSREIEVYLNFIGKFDVPVQPVELSPEEQKRQEALKKRRIHQRNKRAQERQERMSAQLKNESPNLNQKLNRQKRRCPVFHRAASSFVLSGKECL